MNGVHDLGGVDGFGPVLPEEPGAPLFHARWESRVFALSVAAGALGAWNIDENRHAIERMDPVEYLRFTYYGRWLSGLERLLLEKGLVGGGELAPNAPVGGGWGGVPDTAPGHTAPPPDPLSGERPSLRPALTRSTARRLIERGSSARREPPVAPRHRLGARVRARNLHPGGHTRLPRYVRGRVGVVIAHRGTFVFPDTHAMTGDPDPQPLYSVSFSAHELWGEDGERGTAVVADLWERHLEPEDGER